MPTEPRGKTAAAPSKSPPDSPRTRATFAIASFFVPFLVALFGTRSTPDVAHDPSTLRVLGLSFTGAFHALDTWLAAPFVLLPLGTRAFRASLAGALVTGLAGLVAFRLAEPLLVRTKPGRPPTRLAHAVAALGVVTAICAPPWQMEGSTVGGTVTGAALVLVAAWAGLRKSMHYAWMALLLGSAFGWEPLVGLLASAVLGAGLVFAEERPKWPSRRRALRMVGAFALGLFPFGLGFVSKAGSGALVSSAKTWDGTWGEGANAPGALGWHAFARDELGYVFAAAAVVGAGLALYRKETRARGAVLVTVVLGAALAYSLGLAHGPSRFSAPLLAAIAAAGALASSGLYEIVERVRVARIPFAPASAALLVVLEWTLPVRAADDAFTRRAAVSRHAPRAFAVNALGSAPPAAIVLVPDARVLERLQASRATGDLRADLELFPVFDLKSPLARDAVDREPKLAGLYRDLALGTLPEEWSLSSIAAVRPLLLSYDPKWKPILAKHLVPDGLFSRFEPEPQGQSDRRIALEKSLKRRTTFATDVAGPGRDAGLQSLVAHLLRSRAIAMAATSERENLSKALDELRPFAPDDPVASQLVRRTVTTRGAIQVDDLVP